MTLKFYFVSMAVFLLSGFFLYLCIWKAFPGVMSRRTANRASLAACSLLTLGGMGLATFAFFYL
jgi:hypothetical protein